MANMEELKDEVVAEATGGVYNDGPYKNNGDWWKEGGYIVYQVKSGDNLSSIAAAFRGFSWQQIAQINGIKDANKIYPGQRIKVKYA